MAKNLKVDTVTIASAGTTSTAIQLASNRVPLAIVTPAAMTGTSLTFLSSDDGTTYSPVYYEGTLYSVAMGTAASRHIALDRRAFESVKTVQIVSSSAEGALRTLKIISGE
jgi:hypothetical protein